MQKQRSIYRSHLIALNKMKVVKRKQRDLITDSTDFYKMSEEEIGTENEYLKTYLKQSSYSKNPAKRLFMTCKRKLRSAKNDVLFLGNIFRDWLSYTFCCVMMERKKQKGVLKSAKI